MGIKSLRVTPEGVMPLTRWLSQEFPGHPVAALMGPNLYKEMAQGEFAEATIGVADADCSETLSMLFNTTSFYAECVSDVEAVDLCGCMKNTITLSCGFAEGLGWGSNVRAAIIRKGLLEIASFLREFLPRDRAGAMDTESIMMKACGVGDLILSCTAGRGRQLAAEFVRQAGNSWEELESKTMGGMHIPDWRNIIEAHGLLSRRGILENYPLLAQTYRIAFAGAEPASIIEALRGVQSTGNVPASMKFSLDFEGKIALVTGAGNGVGRCIAERLCQTGASVLAVDRDEEALKDLCDQQPLCKAVPCDLADLDSLRNVVAQAGVVDLLVQAGGILILQPFGEQTPDVWDATLDINSRAVWFLTHEIGKGMASRGQGAVVNISSQSSSVAVSEKHMAYSTAKAAVDQITRLAAYALAKSNVRVNAVNPTVVRTALAVKGHGEEGLKKMAAKVPLGRICEPDDVADACLYLLSDRARMITGVTLPVDGGFISSRP